MDIFLTVMYTFCNFFIKDDDSDDSGKGDKKEEAPSRAKRARRK